MGLKKFKRGQIVKDIDQRQYKVMGVDGCQVRVKPIGGGEEITLHANGHTRQLSDKGGLWKLQEGTRFQGNIFKRFR